MREDPPGRRADGEAVSREPRAAVIGAGISGLSCARVLMDHGISVIVFEKSRGVGGRMATRRTDDGLRFDHGAQYFTVRDERFERAVQSWIQRGIVARWEGHIGKLTRGEIEYTEEPTRRFVGVPAMNSICKDLSEELDVRLGVHVSVPNREHGIWRLSDQQRRTLGDFDCVVTSAPALQSADLLTSAPRLQRLIQGTVMHGCWAAMLSFQNRLEVSFDGAFVHDSPLSWVARNSSKPERSDVDDAWILHASADWTESCIDESAENVLPRLLAAFWEATQLPEQTPTHSICHRWRHAIPPQPLPHRCLFDPQLQIGACGDWCGGPRVEGAFLSGLAIAEKLLAHFDNGCAMRDDDVD